MCPPPSEKSPFADILTSCRYFQHTWIFPPYMGIITSCGHSHLEWAFSPHMDILIDLSHGHFHLTYMQDHFLRYGGVFPPPSEKSPHISILTSDGHYHLR